MRRQPCRGCGRPKGDGARRIYCDACQRERLKPPPCSLCGLRPIRGKHKNHCVECHAGAIERRRVWQRDYVAKKKASDPAYAERQRAAERRSYFRAKRRRPRFPLGPKLMAVASAPIAAFIDSLANSERDIAPVCERAGTTTRSVYAWRVGERETIPFDTADGILTNLDACWWEVFDPAIAPALFSPLEWCDVVDKAALAWEGEGLLG
jgi:hypothetical protein